jgi:hypothetical protein
MEPGCSASESFKADSDSNSEAWKAQIHCQRVPSLLISRSSLAHISRPDNYLFKGAGARVWAPTQVRHAISLQFVSRTYHVPQRRFRLGDLWPPRFVMGISKCRASKVDVGMAVSL